jgi:hypothetical protein
MNCCNPMTGQCEQGHGCPGRAAKVAPHHPHEAGNVWFAEPESVKLTRIDYALLAVFCLAMFAIACIFVGLLYSHREPIARAASSFFWLTLELIS